MSEPESALPPSPAVPPAAPAVVAPAPRPAKRPEVPLAATCLVILIALGSCSAVVAAGLAVAVARARAPSVAEGARHRSEKAESRDRVATAKSLLDAMAARLLAIAHADRELPEMLAEAPPRDPWGRAVDYERLAPDRALLRSAGPDGRPGTRDDVTRDVVMK